jgi:hypothetical protein
MRRDGSMSRGFARSLKKGCGGRAAGPDARTDEHLRPVGLPLIPSNLQKRTNRGQFSSLASKPVADNFAPSAYSEFISNGTALDDDQHHRRANQQS